MTSPGAVTQTPSPSTVLGNRSFINSHPEPVQQDSTLYIQRYSTRDAKGQDHHVVAGVHLIFKQGHENNLFDAFHVDRSRQKMDPSSQKVATKSLRIACDTLTIYGELSLPECDIEIYARKLEFLANGAVNTSPLSWTLDRAADANPQARAAGRDGADGRHAGMISVFVDEAAVPQGESRKRFIALGGNGQR